MKALEYQGLWWLPETPDKKYSGTLRCSETGELRLALMGALVDRSAFLSGEETTIIHGEVFDSKIGSNVTLRDCFVTNVSGIVGARITRQEFFAHRAFFGAHLSSSTDFEFDSARISYSGLNSWADSLTGFDKSPPDPWTISFKHPEPLSGTIPGGWFTLGLACSSGGTRREHQLAEKAGLSLSFAQPVGDSVLQNDFVYPLQNLFTFATNHPNSLAELVVTRAGNCLENITVIGPHVFSDDSLAADLLPWQMLFALSDVANRLEQVISRWLEISHRFRQAAAVYFGTQYDPPGYLDLRFPLVVQALSLYHACRNKCSASIRADDILASVQRECPENAQALRQLLGSHPLVMAERALRDLTGENEKVLAPLVARTGGLEKFVDTSLGMLEYVLSRSAESQWSDSFGREVYWLTERVSFLLKICFLNEIGIIESEQETILQRNERYRFLRDEAANKG